MKTYTGPALKERQGPIKHRGSQVKEKKKRAKECRDEPGEGKKKKVRSGIESGAGARRSAVIGLLVIFTLGVARYYGASSGLITSK